MGEWRIEAVKRLYFRYEGKLSTKYNKGEALVKWLNLNFRQ